MVTDPGSAPREPGTWFVRLVGDQYDPDSGEQRGVLSLAYGAFRRKLGVAGADRRIIGQCLVWFEKHLPVPRRFSPFRKWRRGTPIAISWFKESAIEPLARARDLAAALRRSGVRVFELRT